MSVVLSVPLTCSQSVSYHLSLFLARVISSSLKLEVTRSSEMSVYDKPPQCQIPENSILQK
jgi:hypothetical protein